MAHCIQRVCARACLAVSVLHLAAATLAATDLARITLREPLGQTWTDEWLTEEFRLDAGPTGIRVADLHLLDNGRSLPAQFFEAADGRLLSPTNPLTGPRRVLVLFQTSIARSSSRELVLVAEPGRPREWQPVRVSETEDLTRIDNGRFEIELPTGRQPALARVRSSQGVLLMPQCEWPADAQPASVRQEILEAGPARVLCRRTFTFPDPACHYSLTLDIRAGDPWIDVTDSGTLGAGSAIRLDLRELAAGTVYHPYAYNARTFRPGGPEEDSTLQPPQHPIATLGPIWRDIWYNGGPFAFVYRAGSETGLGVAAVRGSEWRTADGITPESQNLEIHGHPEQPGQVWLRLPTDGVRQRRWALIVGPPELRQRLSRLTRSHADLPFDKIRREWVLDWESDAPGFSAGAAGNYLGGHYNQHFFNPTTFPRTVRRQVDAAFKQHRHVKSRDLAVLAYVFSDPNYWPGPDYPWKIGNPNFHTDMYNIPLKIGLLMPDHPHAPRWVEQGVRETYGNLMRDSFPGGAWAESLSYSAFFFHVAENIALLRDYGVTNGFAAWPRLREVAAYLARLHTPVDPRYGTRQKAPIGDTGPGHYLKELNHLAAHFAGVDDRLAEQLRRFPEPWADALDLGSRAFPGFGAMLRGNPYDPRHESFVTLKAGPARNHYQGDELAFHFSAFGTPLAIDHACHYSPRPWSAAIHNRPDMNNHRPVAVAEPRAFHTSTAADVFVADERTTRINEVPIEPHECVKPGWEYPTRFLPNHHAWTLRRYLLLVKHDPARSRLPDYLVVRDELRSPEPVWWNLHVLARAIQGDGPAFHFPGQLGVDLTAHFLAPEISTVERRQWGWSGSGGDRRTAKGDHYERAHFSRFIPPDFERGAWKPDDGERTVWLRVRADAGTSEWLVVLLPHLQHQPAPTVERLGPTRARISLGSESEIVDLGTAGQHQAAVESAGRRTILIPAQHIPDLDHVSFGTLPRRLDRGGL